MRRQGISNHDIYSVQLDQFSPRMLRVEVQSTQDHY